MLNCLIILLWALDMVHHTLCFAGLKCPSKIKVLTIKSFCQGSLSMKFLVRTWFRNSWLQLAVPVTVASTVVQNQITVMIKLGYKIPQKKHKQPSPIPQSGDKNNNSKKESNDSCQQQTMSLTKKVDHISKEPSAIQKSSLILTPTPNKITILNSMMPMIHKAEVDCKKSKSNGSITDDISVITETLFCVHIRLP